MRHDFNVCGCAYCVDLKQYRASKTPEDVMEEKACRDAEQEALEVQMQKLRERLNI